MLTLRGINIVRQQSRSWGFLSPPGDKIKKIRWNKIVDQATKCHRNLCNSIVKPRPHYTWGISKRRFDSGNGLNVFRKATRQNF